MLLEKSGLVLNWPMGREARKAKGQRVRASYLKNQAWLPPGLIKQLI